MMNHGIGRTVATLPVGIEAPQQKGGSGRASSKTNVLEESFRVAVDPRGRLHVIPPHSFRIQWDTPGSSRGKCDRRQHVVMTRRATRPFKELRTGVVQQ